MRIHITGNAGAGKTTLAQRVGAEFDYPVFHLDRIVWQPGWEKTPSAIRAQKEAQLVDGPDWVIDGVSDSVRRSADITVFLDVPRYLCLFRSVRRNLRYLFRSRPELPENCPEIVILPQLVMLIWRFTSQVRPKILGDLEAGHRIVQVSGNESFDILDLERNLPCS